MNRFKPTVGLLLAATFIPAPCRGINIVLSDTTPAGTYPAFDSTGANLAAIMEAAAQRWEDILEAGVTVNISYQYASISGLASGCSSSFNGSGQVTGGSITVDRDARTWYFDPTPDDDSEFVFTQRLYQDLTTTQQDSWFGTLASDKPGELLEVSYRGTATASAPANAQNGFDMFSTVIHEMGHVLGLCSNNNNTLIADAVTSGDTDIDVPGTWTNGDEFDLNMAGTDTTNVNHMSHLAVQSLMCNGCAQIGVRRRPAASDILAIADVGNWGADLVDLARQDFLPGGTNDFNTASNWEGNQLPGSTDDAFVRLGVVAGGGSGVNVSMSAARTVKSLLLTSATDLLTGAHQLTAGETATIEFDGNFPLPQIFVQSGGELQADDLVINGGELDMAGGVADIQDDLTLSADTLGQQGAITGAGTVDVAGTLNNNGRITGTDEDGPTLTFTSAAGSPWDLDGTSGNGEVYATVGDVTFASGAIADAFDGTMRVDDPQTLTIAEPWTLGTGGVVDLNGGDPDFATLAGGTMTAASGDVDASGFSRISAPTAISGSADINVLATAGNDRLEMDGANTISGGNFTISSDSQLWLDGTSSVSGGNFSIAPGGTLDSNGSNTFSGGSYTGEGEFNMDGNPTYEGSTTVDCTTFDFDGDFVGQTHTFNGDLIINSTSMDTFDDIIDFQSSGAELQVNGPATWTMAGTMNSNTGTTLTLPSVSGVPFTMSGTTNVNESTRWDARVTITGTLNIASGHRINLNGGGTVSELNRLSGGNVTGAGDLRATSDAALVGYGTISSNLDFFSSCVLQADNGTMTFSGSFTTVPGTIGTYDTDGILDVTNPWTLPSTSVLEMNGGEVTGGTITNESSVSGFGTVTATNIVNNGTVAATGGQTLVISTSNNFDIDGTVPVETHTVSAMDGDLTFTGPVTDAHGGVAEVGMGRVMTFQQGWTLAGTGVLNLVGGGNSITRATLAGSSSVFDGAINAAGECALLTTNTFNAGSVVNLTTAGTALRLFGDTLVDSAASISGAGELVVVGGATLTLEDGVNTAVDISNAGVLDIEPGTGNGAAKINQLSQSPIGVVSIDLNGAPGSGNFDRLQVSSSLVLNGTLSVRYGGGGTLGDVWKVIEGPLSGGFTSLATSGLPAGLGLVKFETSDAVYVKLVGAGTYVDWATLESIPLPDIAIDDNPDDDMIPNGLELFLGGDPLAIDHGILPALAVQDVGGTDYLMLTVVLAHLFEPTDLSFSVTRSTNATAWSGAGVALESSVFDPADGRETRVYRSTVPYGSLEQEFLRAEANP